MLADGYFVQWYVQGDNSGGHWIAVLDVDSQNNITYFDPASGLTISHESISKPSQDNNHNGLKFYFGWSGIGSDSDVWGWGWKPIKPLR